MKGVSEFRRDHAEDHLAAIAATLTAPGVAEGIKKQDSFDIFMMNSWFAMYFYRQNHQLRDPGFRGAFVQFLAKTSKTTGKGYFDSFALHPDATLAGKLSAAIPHAFTPHALSTPPFVSADFMSQIQRDAAVYAKRLALGTSEGAIESTGCQDLTRLTVFGGSPTALITEDTFTTALAFPFRTLVEDRDLALWEYFSRNIPQAWLPDNLLRHPHSAVDRNDIKRTRDFHELCMSFFRGVCFQLAITGRAICEQDVPLVFPVVFDPLVKITNAFLALVMDAKKWKQFRHGAELHSCDLLFRPLVTDGVALRNAIASMQTFFPAKQTAQSDNNADSTVTATVTATTVVPTTTPPGPRSRHRKSKADGDPPGGTVAPSSASAQQSGPPPPYQFNNQPNQPQPNQPPTATRQQVYYAPVAAAPVEPFALAAGNLASASQPSAGHLNYRGDRAVARSPFHFQAPAPQAPHAPFPFAAQQPQQTSAYRPFPAQH
jgi:hypothetical protein